MKTKNQKKSSWIKKNDTRPAQNRAEILEKIRNGEMQGIETNVFPIVYTQKKDGVPAAYDIRTDRFEIALDAVDKINKADLQKYAKAKEKGETIQQVKEGFDDKQIEKKE